MSASSSSSAAPEGSSSNQGWTTVIRRNRPSQYDRPLVRAVKHYWAGFDDKGNERWQVELSDGTVITQDNTNYHFWRNRYFPK